MLCCIIRESFNTYHGFVVPKVTYYSVFSFLTLYCLIKALMLDFDFKQVFLCLYSFYFRSYMYILLHIFAIIFIDTLKHKWGQCLVKHTCKIGKGSKCSLAYLKRRWIVFASRP